MPANNKTENKIDISNSAYIYLAMKTTKSLDSITRLVPRNRKEKMKTNRSRTMSFQISNDPIARSSTHNCSIFRYVFLAARKIDKYSNGWSRKGTSH